MDVINYRWMISKTRIQELSVLIFVFSINFETIKLFNIDFFISKVSILFLFFICLITNPKLFIVKSFSKIIKPLIFYFLLLTAINYHNVNSISSVFFDIPFFLNIILCILMVNISRKSPQLLEKSFLVFGVSTYILGLLFILNIGATFQMERATMFGMNPNTLGVCCSLTILIFIKHILENKISNLIIKVLISLGIVLCFYTMISTVSRIGFLTLFFSSSIYLYLSENVSKKQKLFIRFFSLISILLIWFFFIRESFVIDRISNTIYNSDLSSRDLIWVKVLGMINDNYIWGIGETGYLSQIGLYFGESTSVHNVFLEVLCYTGIIGFIIFMIFLVRLFLRALYMKKKYNDTFQLIIFIYLLAIMFSAQIFEPKFAWILIAYIISFKINETTIIVK